MKNEPLIFCPNCLWEGPAEGHAPHLEGLKKERAFECPECNLDFLMFIDEAEEEDMISFDLDDM